MNIITRIMECAEKNHGIELQPATVRNLASILVSIDREIIRLQGREITLAAYIEEYGEDLNLEMQTLEEIVAEVLDGEEGQVQEEDGLDPQMAEGQEPPMEVPEIPDEGPGGPGQDGPYIY